MTIHRVLKIKQSLLCQPAEQHDILGMIITQHRHSGALARNHMLEHLFPRGSPAAAIDIEVLRRTVEIDEQPRLALIFGETVIEEWPRLQPVQLLDCSNGRGVDFPLVVRPGIKVIAHPHGAKIFKENHALFRFSRQNVRRAHAIIVKPAGRAQERAGILVGRRRIHQHGGFLTQPDAEIAPERGIAGQRFDSRSFPASGS